MTEQEKRTRCSATTQAGTRCKNYALPDSPYCRVHQSKAQIPDENARAELAAELEELIERVKEARPDYTPPAFSAQRLIALIQENLEKFPPDFQLGVLERLRNAINEDWFDVDTWKGVWYMINYTMEYQADLLKRRFTGDYETDEWGMDWEFIDTVQPFFEFMYKTYWRVEITGIENIPDDGRALLVVNHSGQLPWDGSMVVTAVRLEHPAQRMVRTLYANWFPTLPVFSALFEKGGQVLATVDNGVRLLEQDELVAVYPEGYKGVGKLFKERYRLARFGRGGFIKMALKTQSPIIPVSVVGAEETYISLAKSPLLAKLTGFPYFPISPTWPWFGLLGFVPLPTKWYIDFGELIPTEGYAPSSEDNLVLVSELTDQVRNIIQEMIYKRLAKRRSVFFG
ncbi:MAG: lysophospholipid acyltransferase family protein [Anaerolineales bacterium]|jgi:1-acyl-sn-glycerol-3-phosphate acyltransferase